MDAVVTADHFPPWKIVTDKGIEGIDIELTRAVLKEIGVTPRFITCPWARCLEMLKDGKADFISGILKRTDREQYMVFLEPPYKDHSTKVFYRLAGSNDIETFEALAGLRIGTQLRTLYFPRFDEADKLDKQPVSKDELNFLKLVQGRLDVVVTTESQGDYHLARLGLTDKVVKSTYRYTDTNPVYFAVARNSPLMDKLPELNAAVKRLRGDGTFDAIIRQYFSTLKEGSD